MSIVDRYYTYKRQNLQVPESATVKNMKLIVGLENIGKEYRQAYHNVSQAVNCV